MTDTNPERSMSALADAIIAGLDRTYDLVYVDYRDQLSTEQVAYLVRRDYDSLWDSTAEWESDARYDSVKQIIEAAALDVVRDWELEDDADYDGLDGELEGTEDFDRVRFEIEERDAGGWPRQLAAQSGSVLLRLPVAALDEDHAFAYEPVSAMQVLTRLGIEPTDEDLAAVTYVLDNATPEWSTLMGYWVIGAHVSDVYDLPDDPDAMIEIVNPHLYLGNPFAGDGFVSDKPLHTTITVRRDALTTDGDAFGYSLDDIYGGLNPSDFEATIRAATNEEVPA